MWHRRQSAVPTKALRQGHRDQLPHHEYVIFVRADLDFEDEIEGVDMIIDFIGKNYFQSNLNVLRRDGTLVFLAMMSGPKLEADTNIMQILYKRLTVKGTTLRSRTVEYQADLLQRFEEHALPLIRKGELQVKVHEVFTWDKVVEAHQEMEANKNTGKVREFAGLG